MPLLTHPLYRGHLLVEGQRERGQSQGEKHGLTRKNRETAKSTTSKEREMARERDRDPDTNKTWSSTISKQGKGWIRDR